MEKPEILLGEVTDEVAEFLRSMGRAVPEKPHVYMGPPSRARKASRHVVHSPVHWRQSFQPGQVEYLKLYDEFGHELGERVVTAMVMQADFKTYLTSLPAHVTLAPIQQGDTCQTKSTKMRTLSLVSLLEQTAAREAG